MWEMPAQFTRMSIAPVLQDLFEGMAHTGRIGDIAA